MKFRRFRERLAAIKNKIRAKLLGSTPEDLWYEEFFTRNPYWSTREPNPAELERWSHIEGLLKITRSDHFDTIIDFGCGRGCLSSLLAVYGNVIGIEPVRAVVSRGNQLYPHLTLVHGSLEKLQELHADLIVCSEVIEHIRDSAKAAYLRGFSNALNTSGFLLLTTPRAEVWEEWRKFTDSAQPVEDWIDEQTLVRMCADVGLQLLSSDRYSETPKGGPPIEVYQLHLFKKV